MAIFGPSCSCAEAGWKCSGWIFLSLSFVTVRCRLPSAAFFLFGCCFGRFGGGVELNDFTKGVKRAVVSVRPVAPSF